MLAAHNLYCWEPLRCPASLWVGLGWLVRRGSLGNEILFWHLRNDHCLLWFLWGS